MRRGERRTRPCSRFRISYRGFLDTQRESRGTCRIKKEEGETASCGKERFLGARSEDTLCNQAKQRGFEDEVRNRIRHSHAQCHNNQGVLGLVPGLNGVIPVVECFREGTNKARQQNNRDNYPRRPRTHAYQYTRSSVRFS